VEADQSDVEEMEDEDESNDGENDGLRQVHGREIAQSLRRLRRIAVSAGCVL